jgi:CBS-domain-containing membrane protein
MKIGDIMTRDVVSARLDMPIAKVANLLIQSGYHALPVVDSENRVQGMITGTDFFLKDSLTLHLPTLMSTIRQELHEGKNWEISEPFKKLAEATTKDIMSPSCITLPEVAEVEDLLELVRQHHFKTFPVVDHRGVLLGVVTLRDAVLATIKRSQE